MGCMPFIPELHGLSGQARQDRLWSAPLIWLFLLKSPASGESLIWFFPHFFPLI